MKDGIPASVLLPMFAAIREAQASVIEWKPDGKSMVAVVKQQRKKAK